VPERPPELPGLEALPDAAVVIDADGLVSAANAAAERLAGAAAGSLHGRPFDQAVPVRDQQGSTWWRCTAQLRAMRGVRATPPRELVLTTTRGERLVDLAAAFVRDPDGSVRWTVCTLRDAAARHRAESARAELVSTLAHELRSPLTSVKGFSATLLHRWERFGDEQKRHMIATIHADADRVTRLIRELLDVSRIEAGRVELSRRMVELPEVAEAVAERFRVTSSNHRLTTAFPAGFPSVYADRDKLERVLTNLVENAVTYSAGGTVTISGTVADDHVEIAVHDEGPGIPAEQLPLIFSKFWRPAGSRSSSGTGLGLYITKGLVEAHGGRVWARSEPGDGTEVRFLLPRGGLEPAGAE